MEKKKQFKLNTHIQFFLTIYHVLYATYTNGEKMQMKEDRSNKS